MNLPRFVIVLPMVALTTIATAAEPKGAAKLYKWVDEKGRDALHADAAGRREPEGQHGARSPRTRSEEERCRLSEEQIRAIQDEKAKGKQDEKRLEEQRRKDNALINTYTTEAEIDDSRNRAVTGANQSLQAIEARLKALRAQLAALEKQVETLKKANRPVSEAFPEEIANHKTDIARTEADYKAKEAEIQRIRDRYEADKARFRELMSVGRK
jgi:chromosome segregation ATPase